jgi:TPR repeat protein
MDIDELIAAACKTYIDGDAKQAEKLYLIAAQQGSGHAAHNLGVLYITGGTNLEPDLEKSQYWLQKSLESGFEVTIASDPEWFKKST